MRRGSILTVEVMATIPAMVSAGLNAVTISERIGCKVSTLRVRCSQEGISLRRPSIYRDRNRKIPSLNVQLNRTAMLYFRELSRTTGSTETRLVKELLDVIARDDLFNAVMDKSTTKDAA